MLINRYVTPYLLIGHEWYPSDIPHKCGRVLDIKKVSDTKSQLICAVCKREVAVWVTEKEKKKEYPTNAKYFWQPEKYV